MGKQKYRIATSSQSPHFKLLSKEQLSERIGFHKHRPKFAFSYYDHADRQFSATSITDVRDFHRLFRSLKDFCCLTWADIVMNRQFHAHGIEWKDTSRKSGFPGHLQIVNEFPPYQFKVFQEFRVVGFFDHQSTFHVVWFDRNHSLYPHK